MFIRKLWRCLNKGTFFGFMQNSCLECSKFQDIKKYRKPKPGGEERVKWMRTAGDDTGVERATNGARLQRKSKPNEGSGFNNRALGPDKVRKKKWKWKELTDQADSAWRSRLRKTFTGLAP
ncbi:hypothetical protein K0M31_017017 [Melipona bicolor]|uniref:Uncharacterized protein n=1 Tax=Melipona bicolor TaxID=60889 RepID=A0AA40FDS0_9HYME|nr:hypothetical protein K0M31_017017 [Melipona bicolor]